MKRLRRPFSMQNKTKSKAELVISSQEARIVNYEFTMFTVESVEINWRLGELATLLRSADERKHQRLVVCLTKWRKYWEREETSARKTRGRVWRKQNTIGRQSS